MPHQSTKSETLVAYVLGELETSEAQGIEDAFFVDEKLYLSLQAVESELYLDYAAGLLSEHRTASFVKRYVRTVSDREKLDFSRTLVEACHSRSENSTSIEPNPTWWRRWNKPMLGLGALVTAAVVLLLVSRQGVPIVSHSATMLLGTYGSSSVASLPTAQVVFVEIPIPDGSKGPFRIRMFQGDVLVATPELSIKGERIGFSLRPEELTAGTYEVELSLLVKDGNSIPLAYYSFQIE